jgi:hypothetical protein
MRRAGFDALDGSQAVEGGAAIFRQPHAGRDRFLREEHAGQLVEDRHIARSELVLGIARGHRGTVEDPMRQMMFLDAL